MPFTRMIFRPLLLILALLFFGLLAAQIIGAGMETVTFIAWVYERERDANFMVWADSERNLSHEWRLIAPARIGNEFQFSPDGGYVVFRLSDVTLAQNTFVYDWRTDTLDFFPCQVTALLFSAWSPDSRYLYVVCDTDFGLLRDVRTGEIRRFEGHQGDGWSPDSDALSLSGNGYYIADLNGDTLARFPTTHSSFAWSPDGERIAYPDYEAVKIRDLITGEETPLISANVGSLAWSPDGEWLAYHDKTADQGRSIYLATGETHWLDGGDLKIDHIAGMMWSADSQFVLIETDDLEIFTVRPDNTQAAQLPDGAIIPLWGTTGTWLSYFQPIIAPAGTIGQHFIVGEIGADGAFVEQFRTENVNLYHGSADGRRIAFTVSTSDPANNGYLWHVGDSSARRWIHPRYSVLNFAFVADAVGESPSP